MIDLNHYGTAYHGGSFGEGTIFAVNTDGTGFTTLYNFTATLDSQPYINSDGADPVGGLILSGNTLYGTTEYGGTSGNGAVFALNTDGTGFTNLHSLEGLNSLFSATKRKARGYRTTKNLLAMLYFVAGKLRIPCY